MAPVLRLSKATFIALIVALVSTFVLPLDSHASRFARPSNDNFRAESLEAEEGEYEESENFVPPPSAPPGRFGRFNRGGPEADENGDMSNPDEGESRFNPSQISSGPANTRFGNTSSKVEFKLVAPADEAHPKNPRSKSYEMYKSYSAYKRLNR